jgi:competence protein ComEC
LPQVRIAIALAHRGRGLTRDRPYHVALFALVVGLCLAAVEPGLTAAAAAALAAALACARAPALGVACAALVLAGAAAGNARMDAIDAPARRLASGTELDVRAHLLERPRGTAFGSRAAVGVSSGPAHGARLLARAPRALRWPRHIAVGAELRLRGLVRRPSRRRLARFDFPAYLRRRGIAGELWLHSVRATGRRRGGLQGKLDAMRRRAERSVTAGLDRDAAALLLGMVLGQDDRIDEGTREDWRAAGLAHLLAVSGQNVMLLAALALPALALAGLRPPARAAVLLGLIAVYVPLAGAGPSLQRAGVMGAASVAALAASRPASRSYALLLAAAATLLVNPRACGDPGWQLSFAAVVGILLVVPPLRRVLGRSGLAEAVAVTLAATLATAPLLAHHFGSVPLAAVPANLLALPAVAPVMWLGMVQTALGQAAAAGEPLAWAAGALGEGLGLVARAPLAYLAWVAERFASVPGGRLRLPLGSTTGLLVAYAALLALGLAAGRALGPLGRRAEAWAAARRRLPRRRRAALVALLCAAGLALLGRALSPPAPPRALTVSFLDVGQGDATLVQDPGGAAVLFDGGPPEAGVARLLRRAGVRRLAVVVATHASRDHHGGLREVLERYPVGLFLDGGDGSRDPAFRAVEATADRRGVRRVQATAPLSLSAGSLHIRVLSPQPRPPGPPPEDPNLRAVIAVVSSHGFDLLLSADAESEALAPLELPDVDAMKVPHHGSADPGLPEVLRRLRPQVAAIEVGAHNPYGHPAPTTLAALRRAGVPTYRTDQDGTVRLSVEGGALRIKEEH